MFLVRIWICGCVRTYTFYIYIYMFTCVYVYVYIYVCICIHTFMYTSRLYMFEYIVYMYIHVHMCNQDMPALDVQRYHMSTATQVSNILEIIVCLFLALLVVESNAVCLNLPFGFRADLGLDLGLGGGGSKARAGVVLPRSMCSRKGDVQDLAYESRVNVTRKCVRCTARRGNLP